MKMFIKRETRAGKVYAYRMLLSFKTLVTFKIFYFTPVNCVRCGAVFVGYNSIYMSGADSGLIMEKERCFIDNRNILKVH